MMHSLVMRHMCAAGLYFQDNQPSVQQVIKWFNWKNWLDWHCLTSLILEIIIFREVLQKHTNFQDQRSEPYSIVSYSTVVIGLWSLLLLGAYAAYDMPTILFRSNSTRIILNQCMWLRLWGDYWDYPWQNMKIFRFLTHFLLRIWWYQSEFRNQNFYP